MSASILLSGKLEREPESRTSRNGSTFVMATMRATTGNETQFWRLFCFSESASSELMRLSAGDALAVQGTPKIELFRPEGGEPRLSFSATVDSVLALRQPPKERKATPKEPPPPPPPPDRSRLDRHAGDGVDHFNDGVPF